MRAVSCTILLSLTLASIAHSQATTTQTAAATRTSATAVSATSSCPVATPQRHQAPYTAKQHTTRVQTLSDGTTVTTVTEGLIVRDADGRTRNETIRTLADGTQSRFITVYDPATGTRMSWSVGGSASKVVTVSHQSQPSATPAPVTQTNRRYYPYHSESLPPQTINDLYAEGFRNTRTTPAGYEGNDRDIVNVMESWNAPALGILLRTINDDPRFGKTTTEVTDIQQTVPDPALFKAPDGYQIKDGTR